MVLSGFASKQVAIFFLEGTQESFAGEPQVGFPEPCFSEEACTLKLLIFSTSA